MIYLIIPGEQQALIPANKLLNKDSFRALNSTNNEKVVLSIDNLRTIFIGLSNFYQVFSVKVTKYFGPTFVTQGSPLTMKIVICWRWRGQGVLSNVSFQGKSSHCVLHGKGYLVKLLLFFAARSIHNFQMEVPLHCIGAHFQFEASSGNADEPKLFRLAISLANKSDDAFPISLASFANRNLCFQLNSISHVTVQ